MVLVCEGSLYPKLSGQMEAGPASGRRDVTEIL